MDQRLRALNQGEHRPQSATAFADFTEQEWMSLNFPTYKLTTQRSYRLVLHRLACALLTRHRQRSIQLQPDASSRTRTPRPSSISSGHCSQAVPNRDRAPR
jgi:hypothetical protein